MPVLNRWAESLGSLLQDQGTLCCVHDTLVDMANLPTHCLIRCSVQFKTPVSQRYVNVFFCSISTLSAIIASQHACLAVKLQVALFDVWDGEFNLGDGTL